MNRIDLADLGSMATGIMALYLSWIIVSECLGGAMKGWLWLVRERKESLRKGNATSETKEAQ